MKTAVLFSGQGGQFPGMMRDLIDAYPTARELFELASDVLKRDIYDLAMGAAQEELDLTENTQPCVLACELAAFRVFRELGAPFSAAAGFSLGEWAALSACGAAAEKDVLYTVAKRAAAMQRAVPAGAGAMAAIQGRDEIFVRELCQAIGNVYPANFNCPGNITVAGSAQAVDRLLETALEQGITAVKVKVSVPSHCLMMTPAVVELEPFLKAIPLQEPQVEFVMNAVGTNVTDVDEIREDLKKQLICPVRFQQSIEHLLSKGYDTFIEIGPGKTLSNMVRRIAKQAEISVKILQFNSLSNAQKTAGILV